MSKKKKKDLMDLALRSVLHRVLYYPIHNREEKRKQDRYFNYLKHRFPSKPFDWFQDFLMVILFLVLLIYEWYSAFWIIFILWFIGEIASASLRSKLEEKAGVEY